MEFHEQEYDLYLLIARGGDSPMWSWKKWNECSEILGPLMTSRRGSVGIRVNQLDITIMGKAKSVKFGRLVWKKESFAKWTHGSELTADKSKNWLFGGTSIWSPIWTKCLDENLPPDFYFDLNNEESGHYMHRDKLSFNTTVVIAARRSLSPEYLEEVKQKILRLGIALNADLVAHRKRNWGIRIFGSSGYTYAINDMAITKHGLLNNNLRWDQIVPSPDILHEKEKWEIL